MSGGLIFEYGGYQHQAGEVYPQMIEIRPVTSDRGYRFASDIRFQVGGSFCRHPDTPLTPTDINGLISGLNNAYLHDYGDFGFRLADGTLTEHYVFNDGGYNLSGNKVLSKSWLYKTPAEFANTRTYSISLGCRLLESESSILYFNERIGLRGTGGARWTFRERYRGIPIREDISQYTCVEIFQRGVIIGTTGLVAAPAPWWPDSEQVQDRYIERISPRLHGHLSFNRATHYGLTYSYRFLMATNPNQAPNVWGF